MKRERSIVFSARLLVCASAIAVLASAFAPQALAQGEKPASEKAEAPSVLPDKPPMVLQNRYFLKKMRPEVNVFGGQALNESYSSTWLLGARAGLFVTETLGFEYTFEKYAASDSADLKALRGLNYCNDAKTKCERPEPSFTRLRSAHMVSATFAPIYGKVNLLDWFILYSDIYANIGLATLSTSDGSKPAGVFGIGQRFYFAKSYNFRVDVVDHAFQETRENLGVKKKNARNAWTWSVGVSAFLRD